MHRGTSRRTFLAGAGAGSLALLLGTGAVATDRAYASPGRIDKNLFSLGVASGDPTSDGVVLWTRLAPTPLADDGLGGMPPMPVRVEYEIALDENFRRGVRRGSVTATPELAHSVHPEVHGLRPGCEYFYRFRALGQISRVGRTRTAPRVCDQLRQARFAVVGCQSWGVGFYTAYRHVAHADLDFVMHTGDYIYEIPILEGARGGVSLPAQFATEATTLARYRSQYSLYKSDRDLQAAHAAHPWMLIWDDHEVVDNYANETPGNPAKTPGFAQRRTEAYQAYYENLPMRLGQMPDADGSVQLYRGLHWGDLMNLYMLDGRQYRSVDATPGDLAVIEDPSRTMLGAGQEAWLQGSLERSTSRWNIVNNQTVMSWCDADPGPGVHPSTNDNWNGYWGARDRFLHGVADAGVSNVVVFTGDAHCAMASSMRRDVSQFDSSPIVASEFLGTSISSSGDLSPFQQLGSEWLIGNPDMLFFDNRRGHCIVDVRQDRLLTTYHALDYVSKPDSPMRTIASFTVLDGVPGVQGDRITQPGSLYPTP